jgi:hypothetical protein
MQMSSVDLIYNTNFLEEYDMSACVLSTKIWDSVLIDILHPYNKKIIKQMKHDNTAIHQIHCVSNQDDPEGLLLSSVELQTKWKQNKYFQ